MNLCLQWIVAFQCLQFTLAVNNFTKEEQYIDDHLSMVDRLTKYGYPSEVHYIITKDGYILTTYRIPYGRLCGPEKIRKRPVVVKHGILASSNDFILASVENGLGYILADDCFDVWLPNQRGNFESINHTYLDTKSREYWHFDWHEMGQYDDPAIIDYILDLTNQEQLHWIGHSQGTTEFFVYASLYPEESTKKVRSMHAMAPYAFMLKPMNLQFVKTFLPLAEIIANILNIKQIEPKSMVYEDILRPLCLDKDRNVTKTCLHFLAKLYGYDKHEFNTTLFPLFITWDPAGGSVRQFFHFGQGYKTEKFRQYDHGLIGNLIRYGSKNPPDYRLDLIRVKMYYHYSDTDVVATKPSVLKLYEVTKNTSTLMEIPIPFDHIDFTFGRNLKSVVYDKIIKLLNEDED